nr:hypothetical protein [uncultured Psychroserpens sp.]
MKEEELELYLKSAGYELNNKIEFLKEDGDVNPFFYGKLLNESSKVFLEEVQQLDFYSECEKELIQYAHIMKSFVRKVFKLYIDLARIKILFKNDIDLIMAKTNWFSLYELEEFFKNLNHTVIVVRHLSMTNKSLANKYREYCIMNILNRIQRLQHYGINLMSTPLKIKVEEIIDALNNSIDINSVQLDIALNQLVKTEINSETELIFDLSDSNGTEKIIMLAKLGVIDFLKEKEPFNTSINSLASAISGITGIKQVSVYPMINPMINPSNNQKNNPFNSQKTVSKIITQLVNLGFKPLN